MTVARDAVMAALFIQLGSSYAFTSKGRRLRDPENVASESRPAFFLVEHEDIYAHESDSLPQVRQMHAFALIYTDTGEDQNVIPATEVNNILDAFDAALDPGFVDDGRQTLGGLVYSCQIDGTVVRESGDVTGKTVTAVPIRIVLTQ